MFNDSSFHHNAGVFSINDLNNMVEESLKMSKFDHPNVMKLIGVCIDTVDVPYIVMPYMCYGSLLSYLKKHRVDLTITNDDNQELVRTCIDYQLWLIESIHLCKHVLCFRQIY